MSIRMLLMVMPFFIASSVLGSLIAKANNEDKGYVEELGGIKAYVSGSPHCGVSIILISDVYGYERPHLRPIADRVSAAGFYSVVPDFMHGDPFILGNNQTEWLSRHRPEKVLNEVGPFFDAIKRKGITKFGVAGFCWGGKVAVDLMNNVARVEAGVLLHPTYTTAEDIEKIRIPTAILGGQNDKTASPALLQRYKEILKANSVNNLVKVFPNVGHGWTLKYNDTDKPAVKSAKEAHKDLVNWFLKYSKANQNTFKTKLVRKEN